MLTVSDILKLLDSIPIWQRMSKLPDRIAKLEERLEKLETALESRPRDKKPTCPLCGATMKTTKVAPDRVFGPTGSQRHYFACTECEHTEDRLIHP